MALDSIRKNVSDYKKKKEDLDEELDLFDAALEHMAELEKITRTSDQEIRSAVGEIRSSLDSEEARLEERAEKLESDRKDIKKEIGDEQRKTGTAKVKLKQVLEKRYGKKARDGITRCDKLLSELDSLLSELGEDDTGGAAVDGTYESNSRVRIDGKYYRTDDHGKVHMRRDESGVYQVLPNTHYTVNGYSYDTDERGRIIHGEGLIKVKDGSRDSLSGKVADMTDFDQRGHIIGDLFGGSNRNDNLIAQLGSGNQAAYRKLELEIRQLIQENHSVYAAYDIKYDDVTKRPAFISIRITVDGNWQRRYGFDNYTGKMI